MKKLLLILLVVMFLPFGAACGFNTGRREIDDITFVRVLGIDLYGGEIVLTAAYDSVFPEKTIPGQKSGRGADIFSAYVDLRRSSNRYMSLSHAYFFLIGEAAAKEGIKAPLSYLSADDDTRVDALIYVIKNSSAAELIHTLSEAGECIDFALSELRQKYQRERKRVRNTLTGLMITKAEGYRATDLPYLLSDNAALTLGGYAVFEDFRLVHYLDSEHSLGLDFIRNNVKSAPFSLPDGSSVMLTGASSRVVIEDGENLRADIHITTGARMKQRGENYQKAREMLDGEIKEIITKTLNFSVRQNLDIAGFEREIKRNRRKFPQKNGDFLQKIEFFVIFESGEVIK